MSIDLHGGEPLLQKKKDFDFMCQYFKESFAHITDFRIAIQTNATLIDDEWVDLFHKHDIYVGISLDGPREINDRFRVDFKGKGSYDKVILGLEQLRKEKAGRKGLVPGVLSVVNPKYNAFKLYNHFVNELNVRNMDFLLPDYTYNNFSGENPDDYGRFLCNLMDAWAQDDDPSIRVRILNSAISLFLGNRTKLMGFGPTNPNENQAITIASDGSISPDDTLRSGISGLMNNYHIDDISLIDFFNTGLMQEIIIASQTLPDKCNTCCWKKICNGNRLLTRYKQDFNNPSVYCSGLKMFYKHVVNYLLKNGIAIAKIEKTLFHQELVTC